MKTALALIAVILAAVSLYRTLPPRYGATCGNPRSGSDWNSGTCVPREGYPTSTPPWWH